MQRVLILALTLLLCAAAVQPDELLQEPVDAKEVESTDEPNFNDAIDIANSQVYNKIIFNQELCKTKLEIDGVNIFCPRASNPFCFCEDNRCSCCLHIKLPIVHVDSNLCIEMDYNYADKSMRVVLKWNKLPLVTTGFPFLKPTEKPVCAGLSIIGTNLCVHFSDMSIIAGRPNFCATLVVNLFGRAVFTFKIGCFEFVAPLGSDLRSAGFLIPADSYTRNVTVVADSSVPEL